MKYWLILVAISLCWFSGCASGPTETQRDDFGIPIYYSETGAGDYEEMGGILRGVYNGDCGNDWRLVNQAKRNLVEQARQQGANAVLIPQAEQHAGNHRPPAIQSCSRPMSSGQSIVLCGLPLLFSPTGGHAVEGVPILVDR